MKDIPRDKTTAADQWLTYSEKQIRAQSYSAKRNTGIDNIGVATRSQQIRYLSTHRYVYVTAEGLGQVKKNSLFLISARISK